MLLILAYLVSKIYNNVNLRHSSTTNEYKWENNKPMFTFMPHIMAKFTKYIVRTFLVENPDTGQKYSFCNSALYLDNLSQRKQKRNSIILPELLDNLRLCLKYASMQVCKYAICKYAHMQVCKYASMQVWTHMQVCKYASRQVGK